MVRDRDSEGVAKEREKLFLVHRAVSLQPFVFNAICDLAKLHSGHLVEVFIGMSH
jgi:hypothetical protein